MYPYITILGRELPLYALCATAGILAALFWVLRMSGRGKSQVNDADAVITGLYAAIGVFIGGHLLYGITNIPYLVKIIKYRDSLEGPTEFIRYLLAIFGGQVFYGGLLGGLLAGFVSLRARKLDMKAYADLYAPAIPLFHVFGRIGCFLAGCCYGMEWKHGIVYEHSPGAEANGVPRLPVQLIEAGWNLALFLFLAALFIQGIWKGRLLLIYLALYAVARFGLEFLRGDAIRGIWLGLSTSQWISLGILSGILIYALLHIPGNHSVHKKEGK